MPADEVLTSLEAGRDRIAIRGFASRRAADQFVKKRLDQYDRLWDG